MSDTIKYTLCFANPRQQDRDRLISSTTHPPGHSGSPQGQSGTGAIYFADAQKIWLSWRGFRQHNWKQRAALPLLAS